MANSERKASLGDLLVQLRVANRLLAAPLKQTMGQKDLVRLLASTGATAQEMADVLDTTPATVKTTLQRLRSTKSRSEEPVSG